MVLSRPLHSIQSAIALLLTGLIALPSAALAQQPPQGPPPVTVAQPFERKITEWDEYTGRFEAVDVVEVRARVSGYLTEIHFTDGQVVNSGDLLFVIDARPFERTVERLRAELASARARLEFTQKDLERARPLVRNENISEQVFQQRQRDLGEAEAALQASQASLASAELDVEFTRVMAPISGQISRKLVSVGNYVTGASANSSLLTTLVSQNPIHFYFDVSEADYLKYVRMGATGGRPNYQSNPSPVMVALQDEKTYKHRGQLDFIDNRIDQSTGALRGRAVLENPNGLFTPGLFGRIRIAGSPEYSALLLPDEAILSDQTNRYVFAVGEDGSLTYKPVVLGPIVDGLRVVRSGLTPSDWVIVNGTQRARPGGKVTPQRTKIEAPAQAASLQ